MYKELIQFTVNGKMLLPYDQIDRPAKKLGLHRDIYGDSVGYWGTHIFNNLKDIGDSNADGATDDLSLLRAFSYGAIKINDYVNRLEVKYTRTSLVGPGGGASDRTGDQLDLLCYAYVNKMLSYRDGQVTVAYVRT